jgi:hypothetical protein
MPRLKDRNKEISISEPLEILQKALDEYSKALRKSKECFLKPIIVDEKPVYRLSPDTRLKHIRNLNNKVAEFETAIKKLKS